MIIIGRPINGITINPLEYLLDDDENEMQFESEEKAIKFLKEKGFTDEDIEWFTFQNTDELTPVPVEATADTNQPQPQSESMSARSPLPYSPERTEWLLDKALDWIGEMAAGYELYDTLRNTIGMTDNEIKAAGFELEELVDPYTDAPDFTARMLKIPGIDPDMLPDWIRHAFGMAIIDEEAGVPQEEARESMLNQFAETFEKIEEHYGETATLIFNHKAGYVAHELFGAAAFIANGGDPEEAYEIAQDGAFEDSAAPNDEECPGMKFE